MKRALENRKKQFARSANARSDCCKGAVSLSSEWSLAQVALALEMAIPPASKKLNNQHKEQSDA